VEIDRAIAQIPSESALKKTVQKNILVTGGAGFLGCALAARLAEEAKRFVVVDNLLSQVHPDQSRPNDLSESAELVVADVTDKSTWTKIFSDFRPDIVVHFAAETGTGQSLSQAAKHGRANVIGLTELLDAMTLSKHLPEHIILPSSRAVYGEGAWQSPEGQIFYPGQRSNTQLSRGQWDFPGTPLPSVFGVTKENPTSIYGATKLAQENILKCWSISFGVPLTILRLQNVYGPGQSPFNPYTGVVILFSRLAKSKQSIPVYEDGLITRDFVYIDDVVDALIKSIEDVPQDGCRQLDIGCGNSTTLIELAKMVVDFHSAPPPVVCGKYRNGDVRHASCDISTALKELSWAPKWTLAEGLQELQKYLADRHLDSI
jgi:dTDP-L-rhamnose 4-epimerase